MLAHLLPLEIVQHILDHAARDFLLSDRPWVASLRLVSAYIKSGVEPILYKTVVLTEDNVEHFNGLAQLADSPFTRHTRSMVFSSKASFTEVDQFCASLIHSARRVRVIAGGPELLFFLVITPICHARGMFFTVPTLAKDLARMLTLDPNIVGYRGFTHKHFIIHERHAGALDERDLSTAFSRTCQHMIIDVQVALDGSTCAPQLIKACLDAENVQRFLFRPSHLTWTTPDRRAGFDTFVTALRKAVEDRGDERFWLDMNPPYREDEQESFIQDASQGLNLWLAGTQIVSVD